MGDQRTEATTRSHGAGIKRLLPALTSEAVQGLQSIGVRDGLVDTLLKDET
jgi:hypothetical protein